MGRSMLRPYAEGRVPACQKAACGRYKGIRTQAEA